jgi:signal transduction histidine kinase/CheY-like chemotaxis protein
MTNRRKDGTLYLEDQTITPVRGADGDITHFIAIKRDLTHQRRLEEQFVQAQKMESVGRLAAGIAHDFNNVLTVVRGTADLLGLGLSPRDPRQADVDQIRHAAERAAGLTRQLLAVSRKQILQPIVVDLPQVLADMADMLRRLLGEDIELVLRVPREGRRVRADPSQLEQVLMNLAANAREAMPDGGHLSIEVADAEVEGAENTEVPAGRYVLMTVTDDGPGMDEATRARAFEPFFTTRGTASNSGLGLATVYGIVKQSGGHVSLASQLGAGTTFRLYWPRVEDPATPVADPAPDHVPQGSETLVLVEDQPALRLLGARILGAAGYTVLTAPGGDAALQLLDQHRGQVDLLITDVVMPGMSGRQLSSRVAREHPDVRVLFMSGYTEDTVLRDGLANQTAHFIAKPYTVQDLTQKVRQVLDAPA